MKNIFKSFGFILLLIVLSFSVSQNSFTAGSYILGTTGDAPRDITVDSEGNIYTVNWYSGNVSKITPAGESSILGTTGNGPEAITIDNAGNIYTANILSNNVSKITPTGESSILGTTGDAPRDITVDSEGNIYTVNWYSGNVSKITPAGVSSVFGTIDGYSSAITIDGAGNIYTANNYSKNVSKITPTGESSILGTTGDAPMDITVDSEGNIYTANRDSNNVSKITPTGESSILGTTGDGPEAITIDNAGNIYTANNYSNNVSKITPAGESSILGTTGDGPAAITIDNAGNIYTANILSNNVSKILSPFNDATISSEVYNIIINGNEGTINIPFETPKATFLATLIKGSETQTIDDSSISDPVQDGDTLLVTAEDGITTIVYTIHLVDSDATISSEIYDITMDGSEEGGGRISNVLFGTSKDSFLNNLIMKPGQQIILDAISDPVERGNSFVVVASDGETSISYTIIVNVSLNPPEPNIFWYKTGVDANWDTLAGNWWEDENHTIPSSVLPTEENVVKTLGTIAPLADTATWQAPDYIDAINTGIQILSPAETYPYIFTDIWGDVTLNGSIIFEGDIVGNVVVYDSSIIGGGSIVQGDAVFYDNSYLYGEVNGNAVFYNNGKNRSGKTVKGDAVFKDSSANNGSVLGNAIFYNISTNNQIVEGSACFRDESTNGGEVGGEFCPITVINSSSLPAKVSSIVSAEITKEEDEEIGSISERGFEYGLTTNYGAEVSEEGEYSTGQYSLRITELSCGVTYHFRAYAVSTFGTSYSEDSTFKTSSCEGGGSGSRPKSAAIAFPLNEIVITTGSVCPQGHIFNTVTGLPCTTFASVSTLADSGTCFLHMTLKESYRGPQVKCLQSKLNILSDGIFGPMTKAAVILFQKNHNLVPDGIVGPLTREALK